MVETEGDMAGSAEVESGGGMAGSGGDKATREGMGPAVAGEVSIFKCA